MHPEPSKGVAPKAWDLAGTMAPQPSAFKHDWQESQ